MFKGSLSRSLSHSLSLSPSPVVMARCSVCTVGAVEVSLFFLPLSGSQAPGCSESSEHVCAQMFENTKRQEEKGAGGGGGGGRRRGRRRRDKGETKGNGRRARNPRRDPVLHVQAGQAEGAQQGLETCDLRAVCVSVGSKPFEAEEKSLYLSPTTAAFIGRWEGGRERGDGG